MTKKLSFILQVLATILIVQLFGFYLVSAGYSSVYADRLRVIYVAPLNYELAVVWIIIIWVSAFITGIRKIKGIFIGYCAISGTSLICLIMSHKVSLPNYIISLVQHYMAPIFVIALEYPILNNALLSNYLTFWIGSSHVIMTLISFTTGHIINKKFINAPTTSRKNKP